MNRIKNIVWGIVLITLGIIIGPNAFGITDIDLLFKGWCTLFIITPCLIGSFTEKRKTGSFIGLGKALLCGQKLSEGKTYGSGNAEISVSGGVGSIDISFSE